VQAVGGEVWLDAVLVRPLESVAVFAGPGGQTVVRHRVR
jgi:hypothetical protein